MLAASPPILMTSSAESIFARVERAFDGRYTIRREAGRGGMATVYEALDIKHQRTVAIKVLLEELAASTGSERFLREIHIAANLSHPHILPVLDSGEADGLLFYAMPFVSGETLRERMRREPPLSLGEALRIVREVAQALAYSHEQGVVHRDLKPENIMLAAGIAVVTDFGIARAVHLGESDQLTRAGMIVGTPTYMSPEQATGERDLDGRSDIYSLGCILFEMLARTSPFGGASTMAVLSRHLASPVPSLKLVRPDIPDALDAAVARAMAKSPDDRFATTDEFVSALDGIATGSTAARNAVPPVTAQRRWRTVRIAAGLLVAASALLLTRYLSGRNDTGPSAMPVVAVLPFEHIGPADEAFITDGMTDEVSTRIAEVGGISVISRASAMQFDLRKKTLADVARDLKATYVVVGSIRTDHGPNGTSLLRVAPKILRVSDGREIWSDEFNVELTPGRMFEVQARIARSVAEALHITMLPEARDALERRQTENLEAYRFFLRGNLHHAQFLVRDEQAAAIDMYERATALDSNFALAYARLAQANATYFSQFDRSPARLQRLEASVARASALAPNAVETAMARGFLELFARNNLAAAKREFSAARARQPNNAALLWVIGFVLRQEGDAVGALKSFSDAAALDPRSYMLLFETSTILFLERQYDDALAILARVLEFSPEWLPALIAQGSMHFYAGRVDEARRVLAEMASRADRAVPHLLSEPIFRPLWDVIVPDTLYQYLDSLSLRNPRVDSIGYYYAKGVWNSRQRHPLVATAYFDSLRTTVRRRTGRRPATSTDYIYLAVASIELKDLAAARRAADSVVARDPISRDAFRGSFALLEAARIYARLGMSDAAFALLDTLLRLPSPASPTLLTVDPAFALLREDPRFRSLSGVRP